MSRHLDRRLKLSHLRTVDALVRHGSLLRAAGQLGITQPALSRTLHEIEQLTGSVLFERQPRGMRPTDAGRMVAAAAGRILADIRRMEEDLDLLVGDAEGMVAVGALPVAAVGVLPAALRRLADTAPGVRVRLEQGRTEDLLPMLSAGALDLVVGRLYAPSVPDGHLREILWNESIAVMARAEHPILHGGAVSVAELRRHRLMLPTIDQRLGQEIEHALDRLGLEHADAMRSNSWGLVREMLLGGDMLAVMPHLLMSGDLQRGTVRPVPVSLDTVPRAAGVILPRHRPASKATQAFLAALRGSLTEIVGTPDQL